MAVDVARAHLDRIAEVDHRLGAYVTVLQREAMDAAEQVDADPRRAELTVAADLERLAPWTRHAPAWGVGATA